MTGYAAKARAALALGVRNLARVAAYRLGVRFGMHRVRWLRADVPAAPFFRMPQTSTALPVVPDWDTTAHVFSRWPIPLSPQAPDWLANPLTGVRVAAPERDWWQIPDFSDDVGDIKLIWELSRFDWVLALAQRARSGDAGALDRLNGWLADWCAQDPPYRGPNWKCGQEASMRVMHLAIAVLILQQSTNTLAGLLNLVRIHLQRIAPTVAYAMAQDNNHGTSEAAALYIGGHWLGAHGDQRGGKWHALGRHWLEDRAARLIGEDGSFSQYSLNYHRVMLDTFCIVETWRRHAALPRLSPRWYARALAATRWLHRLVDPRTGDGPNLGANDGARLLQLTRSEYRDYRPTVQLAMTLFSDARAYAMDGAWNDALRWLDVPVPEASAPAPASDAGDDGGFAVLRRADAFAVMRYPRFRFRPSQADALHVDLWVGGENRLRDAGTYSYNAGADALAYFGGTASHNTIQFDGRDQMPRLGRFLFGEWLKTSVVEPLTDATSGAKFAATYRDHAGASHRRQLRLTEDALHITDEIAGMRHNAVLRWRLRPGAWRLNGCVATDGSDTLIIGADMPIARIELVEGWESRHYLEKTPVPVLEIEVRQPGTIDTAYRWNP